jgi:hypothetical protein
MPGGLLLYDGKSKKDPLLAAAGPGAKFCPHFQQQEHHLIASTGALEEPTEARGRDDGDHIRQGYRTP